MKKVWYRKQSSRFRDINASPDRPAFFSDDFDYMTLFGEDMQRPKVLVVFLDKNTPVFDVWSDSVSKLCGYPPAAERFLHADALETVTSFLGYFLKLVGDRRDVESVRSALKTLDDECMPTEGVISESSDKELLDFAEWAAELLDRSSAAGVDPYRIVMDDMLKAKPGAKGIIDGPGSLMSVDPDIQSSVVYELSMGEVQWLSDHRMNDMQSNDPTCVRTAIDACRCRCGTPARLKEDKGPSLGTDSASRKFERALYRLEQVLYRKLSAGVYRYHDIEYILGEIRRMWNAQRDNAGRSAVLAKIQDPDAFIKFWKGVDEGTMSESKRQILYWAHMLDECRLA